MNGYPTMLEYFDCIDAANKKVSTKGFNICHNNAGWVGYYMTTPKGNKYCLVNNDYIRCDKGYTLYEYSPKFGQHGSRVAFCKDVTFKDIEECKDFLLRWEDPSAMDVSLKKYRLKLTANINRDDLKKVYDFEALDEVIDFLKGLNIEPMEVLLKDRDSKMEYGNLANTSLYMIIKGYRNVPDCYMY